MASENSAIWQVQDGADTGAENGATPAADVILFNPQPVIATGGYVFETEFTVRNSTPENESVASNNNEVQDMGLDGVDVQVTGILYRAGTSGSMTKLIQWLKDPKTATGYTEGRFGLRLDDFPHFDVVPTPTYGYVLADVRFIRDGEHKDKVQVVLTLRLSGDIDAAI